VRQDTVRIVVHSARVDVICLQETKMCLLDRQSILHMFGADFDNNFIYLPSNGASGGVPISRKSSLGVVVASRVASFSASVQFLSDNGEA
jgi:exonuclease III